MQLGKAAFLLNLATVKHIFVEIEVLILGMKQEFESSEALVLQALHNYFKPRITAETFQIFSTIASNYFNRLETSVEPQR